MASDEDLFAVDSSSSEDSDIDDPKKASDENEVEKEQEVDKNLKISHGTSEAVDQSRGEVGEDKEAALVSKDSDKDINDDNIEDFKGSGSENKETGEEKTRDNGEGSISSRSEIFGEQVVSVNNQDQAGEKDKKEEIKSDEKPVVKSKPINIVIPRILKPEFAADLRHLRLPRSIHIAQEPYDPATYDEEKELEELKKLNKEIAVDNIIRWRYKTDILGERITNPETGEYEIESNARFVQWSDNSVQLYIGNEVFDVAVSSVENKNMMLYAATKDEESDKAMMVAQGKFMTDVRLRPHSWHSATSKGLELNVKGRNIRKVKIMQTESIHDPEKMQEIRAKAKDDRLRAEQRKRKRAQRSRTPWSDDYVDDQYAYESDLEYSTSVRKIKKQVKNKPSRSTSHTFLSSSDSESDFGDDDEQESIGEQSRDKRKLSRSRSASGETNESAASAAGENNKGKAADDESESDAEFDNLLEGKAEATIKTEKAEPNPDNIIEEETAVSNEEEEQEDDVVNVSKKRKSAVIESDSE